VGEKKRMADNSLQTATRGLETQADLRTQLLAQKTHLISELAAAIDNHFNNIMMSVTSYAELELKKNPAERRSLEQVVKNAQRATHLIQKLLAFSRNRTSAQQAVQLNEVVAGISDLLQPLLGEHVEVVLDLQPDIQRIKADPVELEQLLLSLAIHSRNAMSGKGKFSLCTKSARRSSNEKLGPGPYVMLSVSDTGAGGTARAEEAKVAVNGQDLRISLTLAAINRIVKTAEGLMSIASEPERGTSFTIYFPAMEDDVTIEEDAAEKSLSGSRTILVVEDDEAVRIPAAEFLKMEGFKVLQARTGPEAISIASQKRSPIDLLITDIMMPNMSGREVAREMQEMFPGVKVLFMSGDASAAASTGPSSKEDVLQKPFRLDTLNEKIRSVLGETK